MARHGGCGVARLALLAAAAPSLIERPCFPFGLKREAVEEIIKQTLEDRPAMLRGFGDMFFFRYASGPFMEWFFQMGLKAAGWATAAVARAWLAEELFADLGMINAPTLILHGIHDRVCLFPLAEAQHAGIAGSRLAPLRFSGHGLFYDEREKVTRELARFIEEG
jgi:non-heme chloroperoxidase